MLFISKKQLVSTNANLAMVFICKLFQSRLQVDQFKWSFPDLVHIKAIAVFITRVFGGKINKLRRGKSQ